MSNLSRNFTSLVRVHIFDDDSGIFFLVLSSKHVVDPPY